MSPVYGLAECSVGLAFTPPGDPWQVDLLDREAFTSSGDAALGARRRSGAAQGRGCGQAIPDHELRVVDAAGIELPDRAEGTLQFRGPSATSGYYRNPEATKGLFDGEWVNTGDRAYLSDGMLYITGREKDIIIRGGRNISPYELEEAVGDIPGVRRGCVAVFGSQDSASGTERIVVLAETRERRGAARSRDQAAHQRPRDEPDRRAGRRHRARAAAHRAEDLERQDPPRRGARLLRARPGRGAAAGGVAAVRAPRRWPASRRRCAAAGAWRAASLFAARAYAAFVLTATPIFAMAMTKNVPLTWKVGGVMTRLFMRLSGIPFLVRGREQHSARTGGAGAEPHQLPRRAGADRDPRSAPVLLHRQARVPRTTG